MKKLLIITLSFMTLFTVFGEKCALASSSKKQTVRYSVKDSRGVRTGSYKETYQDGIVTRIETYDTRGVRRNVVRTGK